MSSASSSLSLATARSTAGVLIPTYEMAPGAVLRAVEDASSVIAGSTDEGGEYLSMSLVESVSADRVPHGSIIILPLTPPTDGQTMDFTYLAASKHMFIEVHYRPQPMYTYGQCVAYSDGTENRLIPVGNQVKFPSANKYLVATPDLVGLMRNSLEAEPADSTPDMAPAKRPCARPLDTGGEQADDIEDKPKGTSTYILDLDGVRRHTRNKSDIPQREKDLQFMFRAMDVGKWDYSMSTDLVLQPEAYRSMLCEQAISQIEDQHPAFTSCGLISRVQSLPLFSNKEKLKLLLTGSILIEGSSEPSLTLEDFITKGAEAITDRASPCPFHNAGLVGALKNLGICLHIVFSDSFSKALEQFIDHLEGAQRIMEVVPADFLKYSTELALRKFFRVVRSVKTSALTDMNVSNPEECATYLGWIFNRLAEDLAYHPKMVRMEAYYRCQLSRSRALMQTQKPRDAVTKITPEKSVKFADKLPDEKPILSKPCAGHIGSQLGATKPDGRPYKCIHGDRCKFRHVSVTGKTDQRLHDIVAAMPAQVQNDLKKVIGLKK
jgi:hypothetical protein